MAGLEPGSSGGGSDHSVTFATTGFKPESSFNCATITALKVNYFLTYLREGWLVMAKMIGTLIIIILDAIRLNGSLTLLMKKVVVAFLPTNGGSR